jgi:hypothetical protein
MRKLALVLIFLTSFFCVPASAKTFVGVLWPMFGPLPAIGLVELVAELKLMPDVEVSTYLHQNWPSLVEDLERQPAGTRTVVVGYSLGANSSVFVANKAKYVDVIIALQPSMLSWNPEVTGRVGRMIEVYNPNPLMTFGGMGSKKLIGPNIEYIENNDSHPGAQFSSEFRSLVKSEINRVTTESTLLAARISDPLKANSPLGATALAFANERSGSSSADSSTANRPAKPAVKQPAAASSSNAMPLAVRQQPEPSRTPEPTKIAEVKPQAPAHHPRQNTIALLDSLTSAIDSGSLDSGNLSVPRQLTAADMIDYANRNYGVSRTAEALPEGYQYR